MSEAVKISVVTICRNDAAGLRNTIESVVAQDYPHIEYIVVDGNSEDETPAVLTDYRKVISHTIREPDLGIYDAMNKGLELATGEWVIFLTAGDCFRDARVLSRSAVQLALCDAEILIGGVEYVYPSGWRRLARPKPLKLQWGMRFCHQSTFIRTVYHKSHKFLLEDGIAADYAFFLRAVKQGARVALMDLIVSSFCVSGISSRDHSANIRREAELFRKYVNESRAVCFFLRQSYAWLASIGKKILPEDFVDGIRAIK